MSSFKQSHADGSLQPPVHLPGMCGRKKKKKVMKAVLDFLIKVMLLTIQIRALGRVLYVDRAMLEQ